MNIQQLNCFIAAANSHSFSVAAKKIYMSQPNFSKNIKNLEDELGVQLFYRTNKGVYLTEDGKELSNRVSVIMNQLEQMTQYYQERKEGLSQIRISSLPIASIVDTIAKFRQEQQYDHVVFQLIETNRSKVIDDVIHNTSELGFIMTSSLDPLRFNDIFKDHHLRFQVVKEDFCNVYIRKEHPLARKTYVTYDDLQEYKKIVFNLDDFTKDSHIVSKDPYSVITNSVSLTQRVLVSTDDYLIQTPWDKGIFLNDEIVCRPLNEKNTKTQIGYVCKKNYELDPLLQAVIDQVCYNLNE